ncbi:Peptidyl-tRNA hydrolase II family protein [Perilla frutescens var. hirtella]|nr:Peptidyl-tRNA hydrolase II family protein [Perilla frutescens var. frutescens]KAH6783604.1 Peptidyl-tRNA hydrolase II family protein [Perilla frutescens var. hirtella]
MEMGCMVMPRCPFLKPHLESRVARLTLSSTVFLRTAARMESSAAANATPDSAQGTEADTVVQYVVLRRDLIDTWPLGSVVTQGCHASVAAIWTHKDDPDTLSYCSPPNLDSMHKANLIPACCDYKHVLQGHLWLSSNEVTLEVKGETQLLNLSEKLKAGGIAHKLWIEQPENFSTCLATKPYPKSAVSSFFKKLKLSLATSCRLHLIHYRSTTGKAKEEGDSGSSRCGGRKRKGL